MTHQFSFCADAAAPKTLQTASVQFGPGDVVPPLPDVAFAMMAEKLSKREREVIAAIAVGESNVEIASALEITETTVRSHLKNIRSKLGVASAAEVLLAAAGCRRLLFEDL